MLIPSKQGIKSISFGYLSTTGIGHQNAIECIAMPNLYMLVKLKPTQTSYNQKATQNNFVLWGKVD